MASIHHTILKKAAKFGLSMSSASDGVKVLKGSSVVAFHENASKALEQAISTMSSMPTPTPTPTAEPTDDNVVVTGGIIKPKYRKEYKKSGGNCGDEVAVLLTAHIRVEKRGSRTLVDPNRLREVAVANGVWRKEYESLNVGQQRMNVSNRLRHMLKEGYGVQIGGIKVRPEE